MILRAYWLQRLAELKRQYELSENLLSLLKPEEWTQLPAVWQTVFQYLSLPPLLSDNPEANHHAVAEYTQTALWALEGLYFFRDVTRFDQLSESLKEHFRKIRLSFPESESIIHQTQRQIKLLEIFFGQTMRIHSIESARQAIAEYEKETEHPPAYVAFWLAYFYGQDAISEDYWAKAHAGSAESLQRLIDAYRIGVRPLLANRLSDTEKKVTLFKNHAVNHIDRNKRFWASAGMQVATDFILAKATLMDAAADKKALIEPLIPELEAEQKKAVHANDIAYQIYLSHALLTADEQRSAYSLADWGRRSALAEQLLTACETYACPYIKAQALIRKAGFMLDFAREGNLSPQEKKYLTAGKILIEWKEALRICKEDDRWIELEQIYRMMAQTQFLLASQPHHVLDALHEGHKYASKKIEIGGGYVIHRLFAFATEVFLGEKERYGVSWIIEYLPDYFRLQEQYLKSLTPEILAQTGQTEWNHYRQTFLKFGAVAGLHIRTFLRYQLFSVKVMECSAVIADDALGVQYASRLWLEWHSPMNPLSLLQADWQDAKDVGDRFQSILLNRAVTMMKGDLPRASEHLPFSYRNLRNYVALGQINRLGFFTQMNETNQKSLETGIRWLLADIFQDRKEIEGLFDLPRFLVQKAGQKTFDADELCAVQGIQFAAARRYAKLFAEKGLLKPDEKQKNHYSVNKEFIQRYYLDHKEKQT
jgi:hypothetical protein